MTTLVVSTMPYEVVRTLNEGASGEVLVVKRRGKLVALKRPRMGVELTPQLQKHFRREAHALARLKGGSFPALHSYFEENGRPHIIEELVQGPPLTRFIAGGALRGPQLEALAFRLLRAAASLHEAGLVPRVWWLSIRSRGIKLPSNTDEGVRRRAEERPPRRSFRRPEARARHLQGPCAGDRGCHRRRARGRA